MRVTATKLDGVILLEHDIFPDNRGFFYECYNRKTWQQLGISFEPVQENCSFSLHAGTVRGLHYQLQPHSQAKAVRVITGSVFDVAVDLRKKSPTFGSWVSVILSEENNNTLYIPKGFAHGFCTLTPETRLSYLVDEFFAPEFERGVFWNDTVLNIPWPVTNPVLSEKDNRYPLFASTEMNF
ncbi:MAG: dTDP-4-dehydrorhamnose 3,5-epimerase [Bacillota bacterium]|nr:dTDP-4-dehydrorhamnose 3,5-epimerase [Bacillota bacterium]